MMPSARPPAVAGTFYPADPKILGRAVDEYLEHAVAAPRRPPKIIVAPHAGYVYSGPVAGTAFASLVSRRGEIERVVLIGPSHFVPIDGLALCGAEAYATPLGEAPIDRQAERGLLRLAQVWVEPAAHEREHALEVELPFLQRILGPVPIVALVAGRASAGEVADALELVWGGDETLIVVSSDLSHYLDYETARRVDRETAAWIEARRRVGPERACGGIAINGVQEVIRRTGREHLLALDLRSSGDTAGPRDRVVGYGAFAA